MMSKSHSIMIQVRKLIYRLNFVDPTFSGKICSGSKVVVGIFRYAGLTGFEIQPTYIPYR